MIKSAREWVLVIACLILVLVNFFPTAIETVYPVIDWRGGNRLSMKTEKPVYRCGDFVVAQFIMQKQRNITGLIKWELVPDKPDTPVTLYAARIVSAPAAIINHWAGVEALPTTCAPGQYHFAGTITYPVMMGHVVYSIRTTCFEIRG